MERSGNFYKAIQLGYILISILIGCIAYNSLYEWQEIEALELGNKKIDELRKEINNINIQMIKFSLLGETILEWNDKDIEHYHARRMAMDSMLCRFKVILVLACTASFAQQTGTGAKGKVADPDSLAAWYEKTLQLSGITVTGRAADKKVTGRSMHRRCSPDNCRNSTKTPRSKLVLCLQVRVSQAR